MTDWNAVSAFMATVVPWPGSPVEPGYVNLQYSFTSRVNPDGKVKGKYPVGAGWPFRTVGDLVNRAAWINTTAQFKDVWYCLSLQSRTKTDQRGKVKAVRAAANALKVKALWVDMDVKPDGYATIEDALKAIIQFREKAGLPPFSALIGSGSGLHAYWISDVPLTPTEWAPYAHGLKALLLQEGVKCDAGLTTDIARILRVPGTFNHKTDPPKPVQLLNVPLVVYNFPASLEFLTKIAPVVPTPGGNKVAVSTLFAEGADMAAFKQGPTFKLEGPGLEAGIDKFDNALLPIAPVFKECGFYQEALRTGGRDYGNELWMLSVLGTTFMENGNAVAHAISQGHATYSPADTQALYDRKVAERADRGIGYPSCTAIAGAGSKACATCPLFTKGKSPLNIRGAVTAAVIPPAAPPPQSPAAQALLLPDNYDVNDAGVICRVIEKVSSEGETTTTLVPLFQSVLSNFWAQKGPDCLNYTVSVDKGHTHRASVPMEEMSKMGFKAYLASPLCRTLINTAGIPYLEDFFLSMLGKLWAAASAQEAVPFGWYEEQGLIRGFVFGGHVHMDDGTMRPCGIGDPNIKRYYTPTGTIQEWFSAAETVTNRRRPELTAIMLMSFASPLLQLTGHNSVMFSAWGDPGAGKSAAYKVGMSVWGHPILTKGSENSTRNNMTTQMKEIRNLPFYWDEITDDHHREIVAKVMHETSDGGEKGRNLNGRQTQDRGIFKLMLMQASNGSYREYLQERNPNHVASLVRVLEWHVKKIDGGPGHLDDIEATMILNKLERNYGHMGMRYAQWLAANHAMIVADIDLICRQVQRDLKLGNAERFWIAGTGLMILAARYARLQGVDVDEGDIKDFMYSVLAENRDALVKGGATNAQIDNAEMVLARYLKERGAQERIIWTNYIHMAQGKAPKPVTILKGLQTRSNTGGIEVRVAVENKQIIIARRDFDDWVKEHKYSLTQIHDGLEREFGARIVPKLRLLSGTLHAASPLREPAIVLPITPTSALWDYMLGFSSPEDRKAAEADEAPPVVETGLADIPTMGSA